MITETREIYKCQHCRKVYQIKHYCESHELQCKNNPDNFMICHDCKHSEKKTVRICKLVGCLGENMGVSETEEYRNQRMIHCKERDLYVYPNWLSNPVQQEEMPNEEENIVMPNKCDHFVFELNKSI